MGKYKRNTSVKRKESEILSWYEEHKQGKTLKEISIKYSTDASYQFRKLGLKVINHTSITRKNKIKIINNFSNIDTEKDAYILGLLYADGYITGNTVGISLMMQDVKILEKIRDYISPETKIYKKDKSFSLKFHSKLMTNNLLKIGILYNKTNTNFNIPQIKNELKRHFIRGYFDGDGSVFYDKNNLRVNICSINMNILYDFEKEFTASNINSNINIEKREGKKLQKMQGGFSYSFKDMGRIFIRRKNDLLKLYNYLYEDATIYLERKHKKFSDYVNTELSKQIAKGCLPM